MSLIKDNLLMRVAIALVSDPKLRFLRKKLRTVLASVIVAVGLLLGAQPASAVDNGPTVTGEICMQKVFGTPVTNSNRLNCTANDIRISEAISVSPSTCTAGETFILTATFKTIVTANARYDAGFFFRTDGGANARGSGASADGECSLSALTPGVSPALSPGDGDTCGDLNSGTYNLTFTIPDVLCQDTNGNGKLNLPNCTSWHSNQGTACNITGPFDTTEALDFDPDTKSKCVCDDNFEVPVTVETVELDVVKDASPANVSEPGGTVTYTVIVTNSASIESVTIDSIVDCIAFDSDGDCTQTVNLTTIQACDTNEPPPTCTPAGETSCPSLVDTVLDPGESASCKFNAFVSGNSGDTVPDKVEVCGTQTGNNAQVCGDDDAEVDIDDVSTAPTLAKTAQSSANCQLDVTYQVVVSNPSTADPLTLNSLSDDKFGNITSAHAAGGGFEQVVSTTCGQAVVNGNPGPGALPATIATQGSYTCSFVGRITNNSCDITHTDTVTGSATDDDGVTYDDESDPPLQNDATVTVDTTP